MIVFDLEWNSGCYDNIRLDEILQIGAVRVDRPGGRILDTFCAHIRPRVHKRLSPAAKRLPELETYQTSELTFPQALEAFLQWCAGEELAAWGGGDLKVLARNLQYWDIQAELPERFLDLQDAFAMTLEAPGEIALHRAVEYCRIPDVFDYHNALNDAVYTSLVGGWADPEVLPLAVRGAGILAAEEPAAAPGRRYGPFETVEEALANRGCRKGRCPVCGQASFVSQWRFHGKGPYYAKLGCPEHGGYLLRLEVQRGRSALLWGRAAELGLTAANRDLLRELKQSEVFRCPRRQLTPKQKRNRARYFASRRKEAAGG